MTCVCTFVRRPVRFVMYYRIYQIPVLKFIFRTGKAIPIAGRNEDPETLENAYRMIHETLDEGQVLGIFPEGAICDINKRVAPFHD